MPGVAVVGLSVLGAPSAVRDGQLGLELGDLLASRRFSASSLLRCRDDMCGYVSAAGAWRGISERGARQRAEKGSASLRLGLSRRGHLAVAGAGRCQRSRASRAARRASSSERA